MTVGENGDIIGLLGLRVQKAGVTVISFAKIMNFIGAVNVTDVVGVATIEILDTNTFLGLTDTPSAYTSQALKKVRVNAGATALEFVEDTFLSLIDTPASYVGQGTKMVTVKASVDGLEFSTATPIVVGSLPSNIDFQLDPFTSVTTAPLSLSATPTNSSCAFVYTDSGTLLKEGVDYTISGGTVTPVYDLGGINIYVRYYSDGDIVTSVKEDFASVTTGITLANTPMDDDNLKIFTDSGIRLFKTVDRTILNNIVTFLVNQGSVAIWTGYDVAQQQIDMVYEIFTAITTGITLTNAPTSTKGIEVFTDSGTMLFEGVDRTIAGSIITFSPSIGGGDIRVIYPTV